MLLLHEASEGFLLSLSYFLGFDFIVFMVNDVALMKSFCILGQVKDGFPFD